MGRVQDSTAVRHIAGRPRQLLAPIGPRRARRERRTRPAGSRHEGDLSGRRLSSQTLQGRQMDDRTRRRSSALRQAWTPRLLTGRDSKFYD